MAIIHFPLITHSFKVVSLANPPHMAILLSMQHSPESWFTMPPSQFTIAEALLFQAPHQPIPRSSEVILVLLNPSGLRSYRGYDAFDVLTSLSRTLPIAFPSHSVVALESPDISSPYCTEICVESLGR